VGKGKDTIDKSVLDMCYQENYRLTNEVAIIIGSIFGAIGFIVIVAVVVHLCRKKYNGEIMEETAHTLA
jgi:Trk-type K+ transport system membrane component